MRGMADGARVKVYGLASLLTAALCACAGPAADKPSQASVDRYVAEAKQLAGDDLKSLLPLCNPQPATRPSEEAVHAQLERAIAASAPEPGPAFDNLYFVGSSWVSAWVLKTSQGLILIDALNNEDEASRLIDGGLAKLGLNPKDVKYVIVTHGHGDHYGGATHFAQRYGARIVASDADWRMMQTGLEFTSKLWDPPPKRDIAVFDGDKLTLGDTTVTFYVTPGHTLGTLSPVFGVASGGRAHKVMLWGGTSFNFGRDIDRLERYAQATDRMRNVAAQQSVDALVSNHSSFDGAVSKLAARRAPGAQESNPFVMGTPAVERALRIMGDCARAQHDRFLM
ncbi:MAG TPA: MBL fold metallo-hydrolase [Burkholderiaceae bacterium]|nr:MBL fold metallo-hydrolase [Burkholderiaceae bacterium]